MSGLRIVQGILRYRCKEDASVFKAIVNSQLVYMTIYGIFEKKQCLYFLIRFE